MQKKKPVSDRQTRLPRACLVILILTAVSIPLYIAQRLFPSFADFFNQTISHVLRLIFAKLTGWFPFSLAEIMLILLIPALIALLVYGIRRCSDSWRKVGIFSLRIVSAVCVFVILFVWNFSAGYYGATLDSESKLNLDRQPVSTSNLYEVTKLMVEKVNEEASSVEFLTKDFSVMPYTQAEMNQKLLDAYDVFCTQYDFISTFSSRVKPVMLSDAMSYTHITGVYSYFTGEANLNAIFPDYTLPYTAAHELAHQRGIAREDEANFIAFLVCIGSDDAYIRYSGYLNMYEFLASALYSADKDLYTEVRSALASEVRYEMAAYSKFYDKYRSSAISKVSGTVNDFYLKTQGTAGTKSYGLVVDLCVAYYQ